MVEGLEHIDSSKLHPAFKDRIARVLGQLRALGHRFVATAGYRSFPEQQRLFEQGRGAPGLLVTRARPGHSAHNWGLALDLTSDSRVQLSREQQLVMVGAAARTEGLDPALYWSPVTGGLHVQVDLRSLSLSWHDLLTVSADGELEPVWSYLSSRAD
jgi:peptidoglycan L-alanyl-D-glutamate endopeptidase CwlK